MTIEQEGVLDLDCEADADVPHDPDETELLWRRQFAVGGMTCGNCANRVEASLRGIPGVIDATVDLGSATAHVYYDLSRLPLPTLQAAVAAVGYSLNEIPTTDGPIVVQPPVDRRIPWWPLLAGLMGGAVLTSLYIAVVGLAQGLDHAVELLVGDWYFVIPIVVGFGVQVGLFVYVRTRPRLRHATRATKALAGAGTGTSTVSMIACCAHHVTDILPILGVSGVALLLNEYRSQLMVIGIVGNAIGIALLVRVIKKASRPCRQNNDLGQPI